MIPHSLFIKNFLSYGDKGQTVHFDPYHLICLSGKNGHGKSALLDAMTWAVWGQARKILTSVKPDQGLLRLGQSHMIVIFEFFCNNQRYRIRREYIHHHLKPYAQLEFGILQEEKVIPLTDKTIKATQQVINATLKLDYETFINTVFLRQGSSNEFSKKSAKERKELFATILGLNTYEQVRRLALQEIRNAQTELLHLQNLSTRCAQEISEYESHKALYNEKEIELKTASCAINKIVFQGEQLEKENHILHHKKEKIAVILKEHENNIAKKEELSSTVRQLRTYLHDMHKTLNTLPNKEILLIEKSALINKIDEHQKQYAASLIYKEELLQLKNKKQKQEQEKITQQLEKQQLFLQEKQKAESSLQKVILEQRTIESQLNLLETEQAKNCIYIQENQQSEQLLSTIQKMSAALEKKFEKKKSFYQHLITKGNFLIQKIKELKTKIGTMHDIENPSCPLCEQNLSLARKKFLRIRFEKELSRNEHQLKRLNTITPLLKELIISQHETMTTLKKDEQLHLHNTTRLKELLQQNVLIDIHKEHLTQQHATLIIQYQTLIEQYDAWKKTHETVQNLNSNDASEEIYKSHIIELEEKINRSTEDQKEYMQYAQKVDELDKKIMLCSAVDEVKHACNETRQRITHIIAELKKYKKNNTLYQSYLEEKNEIEKRILFLVEAIEKWKKEKTALYEQKDALIRLTTTLKTQITNEEKIKKEIQLIEKKIEHFTELVSDYTTIAAATGKDGLQALLIEQAIPEIESEANYLLSRLSNNNARIFIESLKDLKSGGTKETLDIKIADNAGMRPYELFSGGEAFRIDFALRISISKLVARRAGTSLQTLIIDEGFGSQDEEGLYNIMDALYKIQECFAKIIIVSHLPTMKDQFPVHFVIEKNSQGSQIKIVEVG